MSKVIFSAIFFMFTSLVARAGGFLVQIILGWVLSKDEFGIYALALSISAVAACMRNGGTDQIIIQRGREFASLAPDIATFSLIFNGFICFLVILLSRSISSYYGESDLFIFILVLSLGYLLATPGPIYIAFLSINKRFKEVSIANLATILCKHVLTIALVLLGLGVFGMVIALAVQPLFLALMGFIYCKFLPSFSKLSWNRFKSIFRDSRWVIASSFGLQMTQNIQYFLFGSYFSASTIGIYFFAVQLINSPIALMTSTMNSIVFPSLTAKVDDKNSYSKAVSNCMITAFSIGSVIGFGGFIFFPIIMEIIWQEKWVESIPFVQIVSLMMPVIILRNAISEIVGSSGHWKLNFYIFSIYTLIEIITIFYFLSTNNFYMICMAMLVSRFLICILVCIFIKTKYFPSLGSSFIFFVKLFFINFTITALFVYSKVVSDHFLPDQYGYIIVLIGFLYYSFLLAKQESIRPIFLKIKSKMVRV